MAVSVRTDPLGDYAKALIFRHRLSCVSSGSYHSGGDVDANSDDSPCLSELVHGFLEDGFDSAPLAGSESDSDGSDLAADLTGCAAEEIVALVARCSISDQYRNMLVSHVLKAAEAYGSPGSQHRSVFRRKVASFLRELGHNAAVCKTRWSTSGGITAGSYEFIDVVFQPRDAASQQPTVRYFVDLDFASEFEIARPTRQYERVLNSLPRVFVGKGDDLRRIVRSACDAAKKSLKSGGLSLPPWRKNRYMQNKWFGPYKRTTSSATAVSLTPSIPVVNCRSIGYDRLSVPTR